MDHHEKPYKAGFQVKLILDHLEVKSLGKCKNATDALGLLAGVSIAGIGGVAVAAYLLAVRDECVEKDKGKGVTVTIREWVKAKLSWRPVEHKHSVSVKARK